MLDAVPVALLGFHQHGSELRLISANAAARRLEGLRSVRNPGASAANVFVLLSGTHLQEQLAAVVAALLAHEEGRQAAMHVGNGGNGDSGEGGSVGFWKQAGRMRAQRGRW